MSRQRFGSLLVAVALVAAAPPTLAQPPQDKPAPAQVAGKWTTTLEMEVGNATVTLAFEQKVDKLTGTYTGRYGSYPLVGTVTGQRLDFVVTINAEGTETRMTFTGELDAKEQVIKGSANLGGMGDAGWIARKGTHQ